ncbi:response regulator transcription factor [Lentzea sp. NBRC 102530]|uniref:response regulator n=1 Tax=Lentzea sp. NBRC 102530 TaxID=3032201 RepID=UPI0024A5398F|nr:response regulator transcription factor [Lentzea sp. NBRC 102530]GLY51162.1 DNA-binding response regulator [Lentzea sp. NBRC 102530]
MIRVLLADDEAMVRAGVRAILGADPAIEVVAEAEDGRDAVAKALKHRPDVTLLDVRMPRLDGLDAAAELARLGFAVAILTTFNDDGYLERALDGGAKGFLLKSGDPRELIAGVHALASGGAYLAPKVAARMITSFRGGRTSRARTQVDGLTARERDVLELLGQGLSNAQIARRLDLVEGTVKGHVSAILGRLGAENRVQAAIVAHEAGLTG